MKTRRLGNISKICLLGSITGSFAAILFVLIHNALAVDNVFEFWELLIALSVPALLAIFTARSTNTKKHETRFFVIHRMSHNAYAYLKARFSEARGTSHCGNLPCWVQ